MNGRGDGRIFQRKGSRFWWISYYRNGQEHREPAQYLRDKKGRKAGDKVEASGEERNEAVKFLKHRLGELAAERHGGPVFVGPEQQRITVSDLLDSLEADYKLRGKGSPQFRSHLKRVREYFGNWRAVEVSVEAVDKFISEQLEQPTAAATINRSTQLLAQAFRLAMERRRLSNAPVIRHLSERGNARQGFFTDAEFRSVMRELPLYLKDYALFGYLTGWRKGEIASLRWADVEGDTVRLRAECAKNGEARTVTLNGELAEVMKRRKAARPVTKEGVTTPAAYVFHHEGEPIGDYRKAWATACVMAGLGTFVCPKCKGGVDADFKCADCAQKWKRGELKYVGRVFHDFRRTAVRNMVRAGVPERVAMTISGHKTRSMFDRYNIVSERDLREAMKRTQTYLAATAKQERKKSKKLQ
jgi:integrase